MKINILIVTASLIAVGSPMAAAQISAEKPMKSAKLEKTEKLAENQGEKKEPIITDRPDFTESVDTVPFNMIQLEGGFTYSRSGAERNSALGEILLRVPTSHRLEVRIGLNSYDWTSGAGSNSHGLEDSSLGVKMRIAEASSTFDLFRPSFSLIVMTSLPTGSAAYRESTLMPTVKAAFGWTLSDKWEAAANVNYTYASEGGQRFDQWAGSLSFGYSVSERIGMFFEGFSFLPGSYRGTNASYLNTGVTYLVNPDFQLDARIGRGVGGTQPDYFVGVGAARRW